MPAQAAERPGSEAPPGAPTSPEGCMAALRATIDPEARATLGRHCHASFPVFRWPEDVPGLPKGARDGRRDETQVPR
jgi:hypothetical protein